MDKLLTCEDLGEQIGFAPRTIKNMWHSAPWRLPPAVVLPGSRTPKWRPGDVQAWVDAHAQQPQQPQAQQDAPKRPRGRPRK